MHLFKVSSGASRQQSRVGIRPYESSRGQRNSDRVPKKEALLTVELIRNVSTMSCYSKNCLQHFPRDKMRFYGLKCISKGLYIIGSIDS